jgi:NDP-sugar pyrophosphorylase family protein
VNLLSHHGIHDIAINLHYRPEAIVEHFGAGTRFGVSITYSHEEHLLGSAGAARRLDWYFTEPFIVLYGDVLTDLNLTALVDRHHACGGLATVALYQVEDPTRCGMVELDEGGRIQRFVEKPRPEAVTGKLANSGIYVLDPELLRLIPPGQSADFGQDIFPDALELGMPLYGLPVGESDYVLDIGSVARYRQAQEDLATGRFRPRVPHSDRLIGVGGVTREC